MDYAEQKRLFVEEVKTVMEGSDTKVPTTERFGMLAAYPTNRQSVETGSWHWNIEWKGSAEELGLSHLPSQSLGTMVGRPKAIRKNLRKLELLMRARELVYATKMHAEMQLERVVQVEDMHVRKDA